MKPILTLAPMFAAAILCAGGCSMAWDAVKGSGKAKTETRPITKFSKIEVAGTGDLQVMIGDTPSLEITTDDNILPLVETKVEGDTLKINPTKNVDPKTGIHIKVVAPSLSEVTAAGSIDVKAIGLNEKILKATIAGSGGMTISGSAEQEEATLAGSGSFDLSGLHSKNAEVTIAGSGSATVDASDKLKVSIFGSGDVLYKGNPTIEKQIGGSGSVKQL